MNRAPPGLAVNVARRIAIGTSSQVAVRVVLVAIGLTNFGLVARQLGAAEFGAYALVVATVPLLATFVDFGISTTAVRELARRPEDAARIVSTTLTVMATLAVTSAAVLLAVIPLLPYGTGLREALAIAAGGLALQLLAVVPGVIFQGTLRLERQAAVDLTGGVATLALVITTVSLGGGLRALTAAWVAGAAVAAVVAYVLGLRTLRFGFGLDRGLASELLRRAAPIGLAFVAAAIHFRIDTVLLSLLQPIREVSVYGVAFRFLDNALFAPLLLMAAVFPVLAAYSAAGDLRLAGLVQRTFELLLLMALPAAVGITILAEPLIELLAGPGFGDAVAPLRILAVALLLSFVNPLFTNVLVAADQQRRMLQATLVAIVVNIGLNLVLIPSYSYNGAAVATVASEAVGVGLVAVWALRHTGVRLRLAAALRILAAAAGMGTAVLALSSLPVGVPILAGVAVYGVLVVALGVVSPREVRALFARPQVAGA